MRRQCNYLSFVLLIQHLLHVIVCSPCSSQRDVLSFQDGIATYEILKCFIRLCLNIKLDRKYQACQQFLG